MGGPDNGVFEATDERSKVVLKKDTNSQTEHELRSSTNRYIYILFESRKIYYIYTLPETKIAPENGWLEDETSLWGPAFWQVRTVNFREGVIYIYHECSGFQSFLYTFLYFSKIDRVGFQVD